MIVEMKSLMLRDIFWKIRRKWRYSVRWIEEKLDFRKTKQREKLKVK